jgi:hypothetical protein
MRNTVVFPLPDGREELAFADGEIDRVDGDDLVLAGAERLAEADELDGG